MPRWDKAKLEPKNHGSKTRAGQTASRTGVKSSRSALLDAGKRAAAAEARLGALTQDTKKQQLLVKKNVPLDTVMDKAKKRAQQRSDNARKELIDFASRNKQHYDGSLADRENIRQKRNEIMSVRHSQVPHEQKNEALRRINNDAIKLDADRERHLENVAKRVIRAVQPMTAEHTGHESVTRPHHVEPLDVHDALSGPEHAAFRNTNHAFHTGSVREARTQLHRALKANGYHELAKEYENAPTKKPGLISRILGLGKSSVRESINETKKPKAGLPPKKIAGEVGTDELTRKYKEQTPGQCTKETLEIVRSVLSEKRGGGQRTPNINRNERIAREGSRRRTGTRRRGVKVGTFGGRKLKLY